MKVYVVLSESGEGRYIPVFDCAFSTEEGAIAYFLERQKNYMGPCAVLETELDNPIASHREIVSLDP